MLSLGKANEEDDTAFRWGRKISFVGPNKDFVLYASFTLGGVEYFLYDCVYMWRDNELDIGKIVKILETPGHAKKVDVVWFFRPTEIQHWLGDVEPLQKEVFLASGEGKGLLNRNPLEAICGKCNVVCMSKDERNPQPLEEDLRMADYIFHRTFDVARCTISPIFPDVIAKYEVKHFFNRKKDQKLITSEGGANLKGKISNPGSFVKAEGFTALRNPVKDDVKFDRIAKPTAKDKAELKCVHDPSLTSLSAVESPKRIKLDSVGPKEEHFNGVSLKKDKGSKSDTQFDMNPKPTAKDKAELKRVHHLSPTSLSEQSQKRIKLDSVRPNEEHSNGACFLKDKGSNSDSQSQEITRRPASQTSNWFQKQPWMQKMKSAYERGTIVLLENLDPLYTSSEVEEIVWRAFKEKGEAKMVPRCALFHPHHGQAFFIFKSVDAADRAISELKRKCLMLPNGRPLVGQKGLKPNTASRFFGHLILKKVKLHKQTTDWRKAVSTSHYSQPNTIEYDMALEWLVLQARSKACWDALNKKHAKEIEHLRSQLKTHHNT